MKKFKPLYTFASLWKQFVMFTKNWRRKSTGELVNKDTLELGDVTADSLTVPIINSETNPSVKPIYWHTVRIHKEKQVGYTAFNCVIIILNNSSTPIDLVEFNRLTNLTGFYAATIQGYVGSNTNVDPTLECIGVKPSAIEGEFTFDTFDPTTKEVVERRASYDHTEVIDLGANKIN